MTSPHTLQGTFDAMLTLLAQAGITAPMFLGARHLVNDATPPCIVWVPTQDTISAPLRVGTNPQQLFNSDLGIAVHCWGDTFDEAIELRDAFIRAARELDGVTFKIQGGGFYNPNEEDWIQVGEVYALACSFPFPIVTDPPLPTTKPAKLDAEGSLES